MEEVDKALRECGDLAFSGKVMKLKDALNAEGNAIDNLLSTVLSSEWRPSSLYDFLLGEHTVAAEALRALCYKAPATLAEVVLRICQHQHSDLWQAFTDASNFPAFATKEVLRSVVSAWKHCNGSEELRSQVLRCCIARCTEDVDASDFLPALALIPKHHRPVLPSLVFPNAEDKVSRYIVNGEAEAETLAVGLTVAGRIADSIGPLQAYISKLATNPYISADTVTRVLTLYRCLLQECGGDSPAIDTITADISEVVQYLIYDTSKSAPGDLNSLYCALLESVSRTCKAPVTQKVANMIRESAVRTASDTSAIVLFNYWLIVTAFSHWSESEVQQRLTAIDVQTLSGKMQFLFAKIVAAGNGGRIPALNLEGVAIGEKLKCWLLLLDAEKIAPEPLLGALTSMQVDCGWSEEDFSLYCQICAHPHLHAAGLLPLELVRTALPNFSGILSLAVVASLRRHPQSLSLLCKEVLALSTWAEPHTNSLRLLPLVDFSLVTPGIQEKLQQDRLRRWSFARVFMLLFLESKAGSAEYQEGMTALVEVLLVQLRSEELLNCNSPYAASYKQKLYLCQLLIALEPCMSSISVPLLKEACSTLIACLNASQVFDLNVFLHRSLAWVVLQCPQELGQVLLTCLADVDVKAQAGCCFLLSAGKVLTATSHSALKGQLHEAILPFIVSNNAQIRRAAQYALYSAHKAGFQPGSEDFVPVWRAISESKECAKMRARLVKAIAKFSLGTRCIEVLSGEYSAFDETFSGLFLRRVAEVIESSSWSTIPLSCVRERPFPEFEKFPVIVIASYLEKPANIAGLVRTCFSFGAQLLAIPNRLIMAETEFKEITCNLQFRQPLLEVLPRDVGKFLAYHKANGYTLIGLEQAANSVELQKFRFPEKCIVLLGFEKEGIPADIIPMLDVCVEIPQFGLIRSLNVHVSAAICLKEYVSQHLT